jgi:probable rRNA maturation factor
VADGRRSKRPAPDVTVTVMRRSRRWRTADAPLTLIRRAVAAAVVCSGRAPAASAEIAVSLVSDRAIRALNRDWRELDKPTNVLSFPAPPLPGDAAMREAFLGDIVIAAETTAREAALEGKALAQHLAHLVVHGTLHLLGFDHGTPDEADVMERIEISALDALGIPDPYRETEPVDSVRADPSFRAAV